MLKRVFILILSFLSSSSLWAITCYYTLAKDNCWLKYNVFVDVMDSTTDKVLTTVTVPAGKLWVRQTFPCEPGGKLMYRARFTPAIWENEIGKTYTARNYWSLPNNVNPGETAWNISVCFPSDFSQVPLPPDASNNCKCDFNNIPIIPPKKI
ncbi:MAG: hypothetical protein HYX60_04120 [Legionella longbeachae]|nr:hypothetical protein [Legionella longbeachae]